MGSVDRPPLYDEGNNSPVNYTRGLTSPVKDYVFLIPFAVLDS